MQGCKAATFQMGQGDKENEMWFWGIKLDALGV